MPHARSLHRDRNRSRPSYSLTICASARGAVASPRLPTLGRAAPAHIIRAAGALRPPTGVLTRLKKLDVGGNFEITDAGCATLTAAIDSGILPVLEEINLKHTHASDASRAAVQDALMWRLTNFRTAEVAHEVAHALLSLGS